MDGKKNKVGLALDNVDPNDYIPKVKHDKLKDDL
jgi:hypothetical protein